jgi:hypothetical protein
MTNKDENMNLVRYILMLPISIFVAGLLILINEHAEKLYGSFVIFAAMLAFLGTFEFIMPKKIFGYE